MKGSHKTQTCMPLKPVTIRDCGGVVQFYAVTKSEVRARSREAGLFTWNKPAYACLATRVPTGERISGEKLEAVEKSEEYLFSLGFTNFRVRLRDGGALLQFTAKQQEKAQAELEKIKTELSKYFGVIKLDPKARAESQ